MTTSPRHEIHIKPIIVSHRDHDHQSQETPSGPGSPSSVENSIASLPKQSSSLKRVSFGSSKGTVVETYIYERVPTIEEGYYGPVSGGSSVREYDGIDVGPPSKVTVRTLESQTPSYIAPASILSSEVSLTKLNNGGISGTGVVLIKEIRDVAGLQSQVPTVQKMEDIENPFRPDGRLSHEVEPIVECYRTRPFPSSTSADFMDGEVPLTKSPPSSPGKQSTPLPSSPTKNGGKETVTQPQDIKLTLTNTDGHNSQLEVQHKQVMSPKAGHAEIVHIEKKKKKCGCCSIQ